MSIFVCTCGTAVPCVLAVMLTVIVLGWVVVMGCLLAVAPDGTMPTTFWCTPKNSRHCDTIKSYFPSLNPPINLLFYNTSSKLCLLKSMWNSNINYQLYLNALFMESYTYRPFSQYHCDCMSVCFYSNIDKSAVEGTGFIYLHLLH